MIRIFTKENTRIFIDTNIFLNLYHSNVSGSVEAFMKVLFRHRNLLITTEQSFNEFLRNRTRIIKQFRENFLALRTKDQTSSFVRSLEGYKEYASCLTELQNQHKNLLKRIDLTISDARQDFIYNGFIKLWRNNKILTTDTLIQLAIKRKAIGDPPGGDKYTNGDELIWEALLQQTDHNLIIVSRDRTYSQNEEYLKYEYHLKTQHELMICDTVKDAFAALNIEMDEIAIGAEESIKWLDIIVQALRQLGGRAHLSQIYEECEDIISLFYPDKGTNNAMASTIRRTIYQHSSDVTAYLGKEDLFHQIDSGVWELRK